MKKNLFEIKSKITLQAVITSLIAVFAVVGIVGATTTIGTNISTGGTLSVTGATTFNSVSYTWPSSNGSSGQFLTTDGAGTLSWSTASPSSGGGWTDNGVTVSPTSIDDQFLIGTTTVAGLSQLTVEATSTAATPLSLRGYTGQTANLFQIQNVAGTNLLTVSSSGALIAAGAITANGGITVPTGDTLNIVDDGAGLLFNGTALTATVAELNILDGATLTTAELNYVDGVTSAIQTQINSKLALAGGTITGDLDINGYATTTAATGNIATKGTLTVAGDSIFDTNTLYVDVSTNRVGIGTSTPEVSLHIDDGSAATTTVAIGDRTSGTGKSCFDLVNSTGTAIRAYIVGTNWVIEAGSCN